MNTITSVGRMPSTVQNAMFSGIKHDRASKIQTLPSDIVHFGSNDDLLLNQLRHKRLPSYLNAVENRILRKSGKETYDLNAAANNIVEGLKRLLLWPEERKEELLSLKEHGGFTGSPWYSIPPEGCFGDMARRNYVESLVQSVGQKYGLTPEQVIERALIVMDPKNNKS